MLAAVVLGALISLGSGGDDAPLQLFHGAALEQPAHIRLAYKLSRLRLIKPAALFCDQSHNGRDATCTKCFEPPCWRLPAPRLAHARL